MARTMIHENNLAKHVWAEAVNTTCYVQNRIYIDETWWIKCAWWFGELYELVIGELCRLVILIDDEYFGDINEVW